MINHSNPNLAFMYRDDSLIEENNTISRLTIKTKKYSQNIIPYRNINPFAENIAPSKVNDGSIYASINA